MKPILAIVPRVQEVSRPDIRWIKKNVRVLEVAKALGMRIRRHQAQCWRPENHRHGDAKPSLHFYEKKNRVCCFVCDQLGGHSNVDLVMGMLNLNVGDAVRWIAERFPVPNVKVGRPAGSALVAPMPYRVGVHGSEWEVIVRSGMWGAMSAAESRILLVLDYFKDADSGLTHMSYRAIMRYSGVKTMTNVSRSIKELSKMHALQVSRGPHIGTTRTCSTYRVTLDDPKFLELCNAVFANARQEITQEREYRAAQKRERDGVAHHTPLNSTSKPQNQEEEAPTYQGLNLSTPGIVHANKPLSAGEREISVFEQEALP